MNIKSAQYPGATQLMIEEGNFHFTAGIRFCLSLMDKDNNVIIKRLLVVQGDDFKNVLEKTKGLSYLKAKIMSLMELIECPDIPLI